MKPPATTAPNWSAYANQPVRSKPIKISMQLRQHLQAKLPEYMVPSSFVVLDNFPLTPNGKVDRKALPDPQMDREVSPAFAAPSTPEEKLIAALWAEVLSVEHISADDNFFDLGGHSLLAAELLFKLQKAFEVDLALINLFMSPTVAGQAKLVSDRKLGKLINEAFIDLPAEAVLAPDIVPTTKRRGNISDPEAVLLTGATGFLGAFLLHELLQQTQAAVYCLVRSPDPAAAKARVIDNLQRYALWQPSYEPRIRPLAGDLAQPQLGLSQPQFEHLAEAVDIIYHNGSMVNFMYPYPVMKATNVASTETLLRLASQQKIKPLHFVSTMGVFSPIAYGEGCTIRDHDSAERPEGLYGYTQSKWVAEKLLEIAQSRGIPTTIHRPAWVEGHSQTGVCNHSDFLRSFIKGCLQLGVAPDWQMPVDIVPVDYLSKAIVHLSRQKASAGQAYNFANPQMMSWVELIDWLSARGYALEKVAYDRWLSCVKEKITPACDNALAPYLSFLTEQSPEYPMTIPEIYFRTHQLQFANENLARDLSALGCSPSVADLLPLYFSYFTDSGYLKAPQAEA